MASTQSVDIHGTRYDRTHATLCGPLGQVTLRRKTQELLNYFLSRPNQVIAKHDLLSALWADVTVSDGSVLQCISELRRAFGPMGRKVIKTLPRRGYMLDFPAALPRVSVGLSHLIQQLEAVVGVPAGALEFDGE